MKRIQYLRYGGPEELRLEEVERPVAGSGQIVVRVVAAAANAMDWKIRRGEMKLLSGSKFPRGPGHDFAGVIVAIGSKVERLKIDDAVFGLATIRQGGAFAEYLVADAENVALKPPSISFEHAAAITLVSVTAWNGIVSKANLKSGQSVLITGCLNGVGRLAVQISRMRGASISGSCAASDRDEAVMLGVNEVINYRGFDISRYKSRFDVIFDTAGVLSLSQCATMLKRSGKSLHIVPTPAKMLGCVLPSRHHLVFGNPTRECLAGISSAIDRGQLVPAIGRTVPLSQAIAAIVELEKMGVPKKKLVISPMQ